MSSRLLQARRICMVTHSFYENDNRVMRYAQALAERGDQVEVLALRRSPELPRREVINGVILHRIQDRFSKNEGSALSYLLPLLRFLAASGKWLLVNGGGDQRFDLVHVHNVPDFLIFSAFRPKFAGRRSFSTSTTLCQSFSRASSKPRRNLSWCAPCGGSSSFRRA